MDNTAHFGEENIIYEQCMEQKTSIGFSESFIVLALKNCNNNNIHCKVLIIKSHWKKSNGYNSSPSHIVATTKN